MTQINFTDSRPEWTQGTPEWLEFRRNRVGASDIAAIARIPGAFQKRADILNQKLGHTKELTDYQKRIFQEGHEWEAVVRDRMNESENVNFIPAVSVSAENGRFFASLDGIDIDLKLILEVKSVTTRERFLEYKESTPAHYLAQCQWQLMVTGAKGVTLAFVHDGEVTTKYVLPDREFQAKLRTAALDFLTELDAIKAGSTPAPTQTVENEDISRIVTLKRLLAQKQAEADQIDAEIKALSDKVITESGANRIESDFVTIQVVERQGAIAYGKIPEIQKLSETYLNSFRGKPSRSIQIRMKGEA